MIPLAESPPEAEYAYAQVGDTEVAVQLPQVDRDEEQARLSKELSEAESYVARLKKQLSNEQFLSKAPDAVVQDMRDKLSEAEVRATGIRDRIATL